jgi:hypothetical protein
MKIEDLKTRTNQKLHFALIFLKELKDIHSSQGVGSNFERAHQEAFLAQVYGAYSAFLIELNQYLGCGVQEDKVYLKTLRERNKTSRVLEELNNKINNSDDWFSILGKMRHYSTHISSIGLAFHYPGGTSLIHPTTKKEQKEDFVTTFSHWLSEMEQLIDRLRKEAIVENRFRG